MVQVKIQRSLISQREHRLDSVRLGASLAQSIFKRFNSILRIKIYQILPNALATLGRSVYL
jgi:hypothetical protein